MEYMSNLTFAVWTWAGTTEEIMLTRQDTASRITALECSKLTNFPTTGSKTQHNWGW